MQAILVEYWEWAQYVEAGGLREELFAARQDRSLEQGISSERIILFFDPLLSASILYCRAVCIIGMCRPGGGVENGALGQPCPSPRVFFK